MFTLDSYEKSAPPTRGRRLISLSVPGAEQRPVEGGLSRHAGGEAGGVAGLPAGPRGPHHPPLAVVVGPAFLAVEEGPPFLLGPPPPEGVDQLGPGGAVRRRPVAVAFLPGGVPLLGLAGEGQGEARAAPREISARKTGDAALAAVGNVLGKLVAGLASGAFKVA